MAWAGASGGLCANGSDLFPAGHWVRAPAAHDYHLSSAYPIPANPSKVRLHGTFSDTLSSSLCEVSLLTVPRSPLLSFLPS